MLATKSFHFDDFLHTQGFLEEKHGSSYDFIKLKYGQEGYELIRKLIKEK